MMKALFGKFPNSFIVAQLTLAVLACGEAATELNTDVQAVSLELPMAPLPSPDALPSASVGMTVDESYRVIPHRRTQFDPNATTLTNDEREYLAYFFKLVDQAIVLRVNGMLTIEHPTEFEETLRQLGELIQFAQALPYPARLSEYHALVVEALADQQSYFDEAASRRSTAGLAQNAKVQRASQKLKTAYSILMRLYADEPKSNKNAFFDHLCALDFI
jgi:hypothetical protein